MTELEKVSLTNELNLAWSKADSICEHTEWLYENGYIENLDEGLAPYIKVKEDIEYKASFLEIKLKF